MIFGQGCWRYQLIFLDVCLHSKVIQFTTCIERADKIHEILIKEDFKYLSNKRMIKLCKALKFSIDHLKLYHLVLLVGIVRVYFRNKNLFYRIWKLLLIFSFVFIIAIYHWHQLELICCFTVSFAYFHYSICSLTKLSA